MLDYIKQLEQQNEELKQRLAHSEYNNERLKQKGHILYALIGRLQVPDPGFSVNCTLLTSYTLQPLAHRIESMLIHESTNYKSVDIKATYNYKTRDFLLDHVPGDGEWYRHTVWDLRAHLNIEIPHRPHYIIDSWYFQGIPKSAVKSLMGVNLVDYLNKHIR